MNKFIHLTLVSYCFLFLSHFFIQATDVNQSSQTIYCASKPQEKLIRQQDIPCVINQAGKYKLAERVVFYGPGSAITIHADNVHLSLGSFSINLFNAKATGIFIDHASEFVLENDAIQNTNMTHQTGFGIVVSRARKGLIKNVYTINHSIGLSIKNSTDINIQDSHFLNATDAGASVNTSTNITFDHCVFAHSNNGLIFSGPNKDCSVINSAFPSATLSNLLVQKINGLFVENCSFTNNGGGFTKLNLVQFGDALPDQFCSNVIMRNCTLVNKPAHSPTLGNTAPEGLGIYQGSGFLVESCIIDIDNTNQPQEDDLSGIHVSNPGLGTSGTVASNVIIRNCIVQGPATDGFYPDVGSTGVVIEDCLATGALKDGIFLAGTSASLIQNNTVVNNGTNGIFLGEASFSNSISNNTVSSNGFNPITASIPPFGNGISISADSSNNIVEHNQVFSNSNNGIDDQGTDNRIYFNTAYANTNKNYNTASGTIITSNPGDPAKSAENITA